jgi:RimJ/RimL family protein N-acetyltransferase
MMKSILLKNGQTALLREAVIEDAAALLAYVKLVSGETDYLTFAPDEFILSVSDEEVVLEKHRSTDNNIYLLALVEDNIVGAINFSGGVRARIRHAGEFGVSVRKDYWDQGIGAALIRELIRWAQATRIIRKINLRVRSDHERAVYLHEKLGFVKEGITTRGFFISGQFFDLIHMGLTVD